ncbi:MAG: hypothetical protein GY786_12210 [Proteobacteria bacterium]|nr:hypothetical protein [Pseudomonadota bacterium]
MSLEGPYLAAMIARLDEPKYNLAAYGIALSFALLIEAPILMIMSTTNALCKNRLDYIILRRFLLVVNGVVFIISILLVIPVIFNIIAYDLIGLPDNIAQLTHVGLIMFIPWPVAIGFRRFYQGILVRFNYPRYVTYGTLLRFGTGSITGFTLFYLEVTGVYVGAAALSLGVVVEAIGTRWMARNVLRELMRTDPTVEETKDPLSYRKLIDFYSPLALMPIIMFTIQPMIVFFLGKARMSIDSLAVLPVINGLLFIFRSVGLSFQEVVIALINENKNNFYPLRKFAVIVGGILSLLYCLLVFSPLINVWFETVTGLSRELSEFANLPAKIMILMPALTLSVVFQTAFLVYSRYTKTVSIAVAFEMLVICATLYITIFMLDMIGIIAGTIALIVGRIGSNLVMAPIVVRALKKLRGIPL